MRFCPEEPLKELQVMQVHGKCHSLASPALIRWQGSQGHRQGVSLAQTRGEKGGEWVWRGKQTFQHWLLTPKSLSSPKRCYKMTSVYHLQAKSLTEWDRILGIQAFQKCLYYGVKRGDGFKKKKKNSAYPQKACRWEVLSDSLMSSTGSKVQELSKAIHTKSVTAED